jgi:copper(I)-binding protein
LKRWAILLAAMFALPSWAACDGLQASEAWVREAPPGTTMMAGYVTLKNAGAKLQTLRKITSADFGMVEMHKTVTENGVSKMFGLDKLAVPAHGETRFEPGGMHLMLMEPKRALKAGDKIEMKIFCGKRALKVEFPVKTAP